MVVSVMPNAAPEWQARSKELGQGLVAACPLEGLVIRLENKG